MEIVGGLGGCIFMLIIWLFMPYFLLVHRRRESRLRNDYRGRGRLLDWNELQSRAQTDQGMLLVEIEPQGIFGHVWWVEGRDLNLSNCPLPTVGQTSILDAIQATISSDAAELWCIKNLSPVVEKASLVDVKPKALVKANSNAVPSARMIASYLWWKIREGKGRQTETSED
jgi:hypothetical protein